MVLPHLPEALKQQSVAAAWQVVGSIVCGYASPRMSQERFGHEFDGIPPEEDEFADRAADHGDEHVIKLTEAALREYRRTDDETLLVAAWRFSDRVDPAH
jgi:hypothetical protein